jgi:putative intracellular protease/amidase
MHKSVLFVVTSTQQIPGTPAATGVWLPGLAHPYFRLLEAGLDADIASPRGGAAPIDPFSHPASARNVVRDDIVTQGFLAAPQHGGRLSATLPLASIDPHAYRAVVLWGGNGALVDFAEDRELQRIVRTLWDLGRVVAAIAQGVAGLAQVRLADGKPLLKGQTFTGVSNDEQVIAEQLVGSDYFPFSFETDLPRRTGGRYRGTTAYAVHVVVSGRGRLLTAQNHDSARLLGAKLAEALARPQAAAPRSARATPAYEPGSGLLAALNERFHSDYEELVQLTRLSLQHAGSPVLILIGNQLVLHRGGRREVATAIPPLYHQLKAVGHMVFGVYLSLRVRGRGGLSESALVQIEQQHHLVNAVLRKLEGQGFPPALRDVQRRMLVAASAILSSVRQLRDVDFDALKRFAVEMGCEMRANNERAQHAELDAIHGAVTSWLDAMSQAEREGLYVVVCGSRQARYEEIAMTYFRALLGEVAAEGASGARRLVYVEARFEEAHALDEIARHIIDQDAGDAFFDDRFRMQRDLLGAGAAAYVETLLAGHPYRRLHG